MPKKHTLEFSEKYGRLSLESEDEDDLTKKCEYVSADLKQLRDQIPALRRTRELLADLSRQIDSFLCELEKKPKKP